MSFDIIIAGSLFVIGFIYLGSAVWDHLVQNSNSFQGFFINKNRKPNVPYTRLVSEVIQFTGFFLVEKKIKKYPLFKIQYYKHNKYAGVFNGEVVVYLKSNPDVPSLVSTVLHEVMHYVQSQTNKQFDRHYSSSSVNYGYWNNPFEVEARAFAEKYTDSCIQYLASKKIIVKE